MVVSTAALFPAKVSELLRQRECDIVVDHAVRPLVSVSESIWSEVPTLCRHPRPRHHHNSNLKTTILVKSRWGGCEEPPSPSKQHKHNSTAAQQRQPPTIQSPHKPIRKASMEISASMCAAIGDGWPSPSKPTRQASMDMNDPACQITPPAAVCDGLKKPMRKASVDMCSKFVQEIYGYSTDEQQATENSDSSGCMLDLINLQAVQQRQNQASSTSPCVKPTRKASVDMCSSELQEIFGYKTHNEEQPTGNRKIGRGMLDLVGVQVV